MATDVNMHPKAKIAIPAHRTTASKVSVRSKSQPQAPKPGQIKQRLR